MHDFTRKSTKRFEGHPLLLRTQGKAVFDGYIDDMEPYVTVTLTEKVTGITYTFNVRTVGTVSDVNLDYSEIIF